VDTKPTIPEGVGLGVLVKDLLTVGDLVVVDEIEALTETDADSLGDSPAGNEGEAE
jgi:hypothetical protein